MALQLNLKEKHYIVRDHVKRQILVSQIINANLDGIEWNYALNKYMNKKHILSKVRW